MTLTRWRAPTLRVGSGEDDVSWLELYFDLIFVASLIQLGDRLSEDVTVGGVVRFVGVFALLWWIWTGTTAYMNRFVVDDIVHRVLVLLQMFAVGTLAVVAVAPMANRSSWLAVAYIGARIPLLGMYFRARSRAVDARRLADIYMASFAVGIAAWALSLLVPTPGRYAIWAVAVGLELLVPAVVISRFTVPRVDQSYFRERYGLFTLIVLGESFVKTLTELAREGMTAETFLVGGLTFVISAALWWTYFDDVAESNVAPGSRTRGLVWVYLHLPLAAGLTAYGVAAKKMVVLESLDAVVKTSYLWLFAGSVAVVLIGVAGLDRLTVSPHYAITDLQRSVPRLLAAVVVLGSAVVMLDVSTVIPLTIMATAVVAQIAVEVAIASRADVIIEERVEESTSSGPDTCADLASAQPVTSDSTECAPCAEAGMAWVELRICLDCGSVGCCDDSKGRHARAHATEVGHPVITSLEPGQHWAYCFTHDASDANWAVSESNAQPS